MKSKVIVDPSFRRMDEVFSPLDKQRLYDLVDVVWGRDEPMPQADFLEALPKADALICADWRYGEVLDYAQQLKAIMTVSGAFPLQLDYEACYRQHIRVSKRRACFCPSGRRVFTGASHRRCARDRQRRSLDASA